MHPILSQQVRRFFGEDSDRLDLGFRSFIDAVDEMYNKADSDRCTLERALEASSHELLTANSEMQAILQSFPDLFFRLDREGRILDCKGGNADDFVLPREQLIGKRIQDIPDPCARQALREALQTNALTHFPVNVEYCLKQGNASRYYELRLLNLLEDQLIASVQR